MAISATRILSYPSPYFPYKLTQHTTFLRIPSNFSFLTTYPRLNSAVANAEIARNGQQVHEHKEGLKFRWVEINPDRMTETQKLAISRLPRKMEKRCKALMKQIICYCPEKGSLSDLFGFWVKTMKPIRADWLAILKELAFLDHPLFIQVFEITLLEESFEANVRDYTKMIHLYAQYQRVKDAERVLQTMRRRGLICDQVTLTAMIHMYSKAGQFKLAEETFEEMKLLGGTLDKRSYGSMIMAYIRAGMPMKGEELIKEMELQEVYAGREVYKALLRTYSMKGEAEGAQRVFDAMQIAGICPDIKFCGLLINAYALAGQSQKARFAFENMRKAGIEPNDKCVAILLAGYEMENQLTAALEFLVTLEEDGILIGKEASKILVEWFRRLGAVEDVAHVLSECAANMART